MWWIVILPLTAAVLFQESVDFLNTVYKTTVTGGSQDLFAYVYGAYEETLLVNGVVHQQVLLLENVRDHSLSMHYVKCWVDFNESEYQQINHTTPEFIGENSTASYEHINIAVKATLNSTGLVSNLRKQTLYVTTFTQLSEPQVPELLDFKLITADVLSDESQYQVSVFLNQSLVPAFSYAKKVEEPDSMSKGIPLKKLSITVFLTFVLTAIGTFLALYSYWKKNGKFPLTRDFEVRHVPFTSSS